MGRPRKEVDKKQFENLCGLQCTLDEISSWFECSGDTIERWCKRTYKQNFAEVFRIYRGKGKISLRRNQWRLSEKNANMAIWLGKQYLNQKDNLEPELPKDETAEDDLSRSLRELGEGLESDEGN